MGNFFSSLFSSSKNANEVEEKEKNDKKNFDILKYDGIRAQKMGQIKYAVKCFEEALNIESDFETKSHLVGAYTALGDLEDALSLASAMVEEEPTHVDTRLIKVNLLLMSDKDSEAVQECQAIIDQEPDNWMAWYKMARAKKTMKDLLGALTAVSKALALEEKTGEIFRLRAEVLQEMNQPADALDDINKAIELMPEDETGYWLRGKINQQQKDFDKARADFSKSVELNPFYEKGIIAEGSLLIDENKPQEAITFLSEVIEENPDLSEAYAERGRAKRMTGDDTGALDDLKKSIELNPEGETAQKLEGEHANFDNMYKGGIF